MQSFMLDVTLSPWVWVGCIALVVLMVTVILLIVFRRHHYPAQETEVLTGPEALVGTRGVVTEVIDGDAGTGLVDINGAGWAARTVYIDDVYPVGTEVTVVAVEGVKVIVKQA